MKNIVKNKPARKKNTLPGKTRRRQANELAANVKKLAFSSPGLNDSIYELFSGKLMALEITDFASRAFCQKLVDTVNRYPQDRAYLHGNAAKTLESQHNRQDSPGDYFAGAATHPLLKEAAMVNVISQISALLAASEKKVSVAYEPTRKQFYCPAIIREFHSTLKLHNDLGAREGKGWNPIQKVKRQWALVLKLSTCTGGETRWFPRQWQPEDECFFNTEDTYSYDEAVVEGYPEFTFKGEEGTLILFDCTCFHAVNPVTAGRRYTLGGFVGLLEDTNELIIWS